MTKTPFCFIKYCRQNAFLLGLCFVCAWSAKARANGRPPNTTSVVINPANPKQIFVGTTFGPAISQDCGATFSWVCEGAVVPGGFAQADYNFFWGTDGTLLIQGSSADSYGGVARSTDGGCNWTSAGEFSQLISSNLAGDPLDANVVYVTANDATSSRGYVYRSTDVGATYQPLSLSRAGVYWYSVQASQYTPQVIVAAGFDTNFVGPYVATSRDAGDTWSVVLTQAGNSNQLDVPEVTLHPTDPNLMFIAAGDATTDNATTILLRSTDGGVTATKVATISTQYRDMRIAQDGNQIWFSTQSTVSYSKDRGITFTRLAAPANNACVGYSGKTLYACGNDQLDGFAVATSGDSGQSWHSGFSLASLTQAKCDANSGSTTLCTGSNAGQWGYYANLIGADGSGKPSASEPSYVPLSTYCTSACVNDGNCTPTGSTTGSGNTSSGNSTAGGASQSGGGCSSVSGRTGLTWMACIGAAWAMALRHRRSLR
jgi:hypothetical protein